MIIKIYGNQEVVIVNESSQTPRGILLVEIKGKLEGTLYEVSFNKGPFQEVKNGSINIPEFTNEDKHVIINVRLTQMGNVIKEFVSDSYPLRWLPVIGNIIEDSFPIAFENLLNRQVKFEEEVNKELSKFRRIINDLENEGEII